ncbi:hypothetical protein NW801_14885 [Brevibacillus laterosporus]|uniref:Uncharacterized protein n=1 Tax=Brevibacillus halotolerans TaxID=1507437 RepID=A0ABT4HZ05_9BACL|nr:MULTISPECIES: hypothetical protein [Brevibacillus]MCR8986313.1 hypothetical protein [Brevibacillus laterosporus]MCZ0832047.1 hypothetical protein [Brevibacillus halotolerans]GIO02229.1 hypothetical protein J5TS2_28970 [Brevibacillus halotolerans]
MLNRDDFRVTAITISKLVTHSFFRLYTVGKPEKGECNPDVWLPTNLLQLRVQASFLCVLDTCNSGVEPSVEGSMGATYLLDKIGGE